MEDLNIPIFAQAKVEYTKQLIEILYPHMYDGIRSLYDEAKIIYSKRTVTPILLLFRELLEKVPIWNSEIIETECDRIINNSNCDWIDDLITAVFISHTKILTSIGPNQSFNKINVTIPKTSTFIHKSYINLARELWKNPYLFNENIPASDYQRNSKEVETIIKYSIENTIRHLLPIKEILKEHLDSQESETLMSQKDEIQKILREELKNAILSKDDNKGDNDKDNENEDKDNDNEDKDNENEDKDNDNEGGDTVDKGVDDSEDDDHTEIDRQLDDDITPIIKETEGVIADLINELENKPQIEEIDGKPSMYISSSGEDPSDEQVKKQCSDIIVNDITIPVDTNYDSTIDKPDDLNNNIVEKYDNIELSINNSGDTEDNESKMKKLLTNMEKKINKTDDINVIKDYNIREKKDDIIENKPNIPDYSFTNLYSTDPIKVPEPDPIKIPEPEPEPEPTKTEGIKLEKIEETKQLSPVENKPDSPKKEIVTIENDNDIDETSTLLNFFNDMKQIVEDKGIKVETNQNNNFTLFEDASVVEK